MFLSIALGVICTEAVTELVVHSEIMQPMRAYLEEFSDFIGKLVNCGYCCSMWAAIPSAYFMAPLTIPTNIWLANLVIWILVFHRLSNFLDDFVDKYLREDMPFQKADDFFGVDREVVESTQVPVEPE